MNHFQVSAFWHSLLVLLTATCRHGEERMETDEEAVAESSEAELKEDGFDGQRHWPIGVSNPSV